MQSTGAGIQIFGMSVLGLLSFGLAFLMGIWLIIIHHKIRKALGSGNKF